MSRLKAVQIGLAVVLTAGALLAGYKADRNLRGVCKEEGRPLTDEEKKSAVINYIEQDLSLNNASGFSGTGQQVLNLHRYWTHETIDAPVKLRLLPNSSGALLTVKVYPDVPANALDPNGNYDEGQTREKVTTLQLSPVTASYKIWGYAHDLVFADLKIEATAKDGNVFVETFDVRMWIDSCGNPAFWPDEFVVG